MLDRNQLLQNRYRIVRQLGSGGMGAVYEAVDERFGQPIALKEIIVEAESVYQQSLISKAFERESKSLAIARHEVVPFVRDYFSEGDSQFLVMELVEGEDLGELLKQRKNPFPVSDLLIWMHQLLDALDYLHTLKPPIIHRDIKPQNLKINSRNKIKLLDFGIARSSDNNSTATSHTFVGATLNYSPVEQMLRVMDENFRDYIIQKHQEKAVRFMKQDTDARSDIFALGGTFYHLMTNQVPIDALKRLLAIWDGKGDPLKSPNEINPQISPIISFCVMKALEVDRKNRYSSAKEMEDDLKKADTLLNKQHFASPIEDYATLVDTNRPTIESYDINQPTIAAKPTELNPEHSQETKKSAEIVSKSSQSDTYPSQINSNTSPVEITTSNYENVSANQSVNQVHSNANKTLFKSQLELPIESNSWLTPKAMIGIGAVCLTFIISGGMLLTFNSISNNGANNQNNLETRSLLKEKMVLSENEPIYLELGITNDLIEKANECFQKKNYQCVIDSCSNLLKSSSKNPVAFNNRGVANFLKGNYIQAINDYSQAIKINPQNAAFFHNRALAYSRTNEKEKAKSDDEQAKILAK